MTKIKIKGLAIEAMLYDFAPSVVMGIIFTLAHFSLLLGHLTPSWLGKN
jgi:hypothetical protein